MKRITISVSDEVWGEIRDLAWESRKSISGYLVDCYLGQRAVKEGAKSSGSGGDREIRSYSKADQLKRG